MPPTNANDRAVLHAGHNLARALAAAHLPPGVLTTEETRALYVAVVAAQVARGSGPDAAVMMGAQVVTYTLLLDTSRSGEVNGG